MGYECLLGDDQHPATWLQTNLATGDTAAVCDEHFPTALIGALAIELGVEAERLYEAVRRFVDREAKREQAGAGDEDQAAASGQVPAADGAETPA